MKISVVIPMYNSEETIIKTLDSIKNQTAYKYILEIIIVDDGSTDKSCELIKKYRTDNEKMQIILISKPNGGVSSARNNGIEKARGDWIALLDSDDEWLPDKTEIQVRTIEENPNIDFLGGDLDDQGLRILWKKINGLYKANIKDISCKMFPQSSTVIFKKRIYEDIGGYDEKQKYMEDNNYFLKICAKYNYYHLPIKVANYGNGKPMFGHSGLSANLREMHKGNMKNIHEIRRCGYISGRFYVFLIIFNYLKYFRRIAITGVRVMRNRSAHKIQTK